MERHRSGEAEVTGILDTDAKNLIPCPKCNAQPGVDCKKPSKRKVWPPHKERKTKLKRDRPDVIARSRGSWTGISV